jgi:YfiR/HmsC-like
VNLDYTSTAVRAKWKRTCSAHAPRPSVAPRRPARTILAVIAALTLACFSVAQTPATAEYELKVAFLFHFAQFVDWPPEAFKDANSPLTYCTIGNDPLHGALDASLNGKTIGARSFRVLHFKQPQEIQGCQVLFIGAEEKELLPAILAGVKGNSVLTVGESEHFAGGGGMIGFLLEENKIRFEINLEAAKKAKLKISSKLLVLAKTVIGSQGGT